MAGVRVSLATTSEVVRGGLKTSGLRRTSNPTRIATPGVALITPTAKSGCGLSPRRATTVKGGRRAP